MQRWVNITAEMSSGRFGRWSRVTNWTEFCVSDIKTRIKVFKFCSSSVLYLSGSVHICSRLHINGSGHPGFIYGTV